MAKPRKINPELSYNDIPDYETDWMQDPTNDDKKFAGESVQRFIKQELRSKAGYFDEKNGFVRIFTDKEHCDLYELFESDPTNQEYAPYADYLLTSFRAPAKTYAELGMTTDGKNIIPIGATGNYVTLTPNVKDTNSDASTGESVIVRVEIKHLGNVVATVTKMGTGGETMSILLDQWLNADTGGGTYNVKVTVQGSESLATASGMVIFEVIAMRLSVAQWDYTKPVTAWLLEIPYTLQGATSSVRYISAVVNGTEAEPVQASSSGTLTFPVSGSGKQEVVLQAYVTDSDGNRYYSDALVCEYVVGDAQEGTVLLAYTTPMAQGAQGHSPVIRQYGSFAYQLATPKGTAGITNVTLIDSVGGTETTVKTISVPSGVVVADEYQPTAVGAHTLTFKVGDTVVATLEAVVAENVEANISEADGWALKLSAAGRSNDETAQSRQTWADNGTQAVLEGFAWNARSGWNNGALVIPPGASVTVPLNVLQNARNGGAAVSLDFETDGVEDESGAVAAMGSALAITASTAALRTTGGAQVATRFFEGDRQHLTFITNPTTGGEHNAHIIIVNNGIMERAATYSGQVSYNAGSLVIAPQGCTVKLYGIRMYSNFITVDKAFCNWAVDSGRLLQIAQRNDILTNEALDADKVNEKLPVMVIECSESDMAALLRVRTKAERKATKATVNVQYTDLADPSKNFTARGATLQCQGTSSLGYPRKNWNLYFGVAGCTMEGLRTRALAKGFAYSFKTAADNISGKESAYVPTFCLKADYAESSGSHNTGVARIWNQLMYDAQVASQADLAVIQASMPQGYYDDALNDLTHPLRTRAQNWANANSYPSDVRTTVDGFPIVLFWKHGSVMECLGQYNFNNDKSTEDVFGFTHLTRNDSTFDDEVECWECLDSAKDIALFRNTANWDSKWADSFEARYPDKNTDTTRLKALCTAVSACHQADGDYSDIEENSDWTSAKEYLDLPKVAAYFVYISRFGAVDQTVKNAMLTSEDGQHWFFINYDNDTILGIDNAGNLINDWTFRLGVDGVYAGDTSSVLWSCLRNDSQFMRLVNVIDRALIGAHLTYDELCQMFDEKQCGRWPERIYNINGAYKYIGQGAENIAKLQGSRMSYRHWWLGHRMEMFDNLFGDGSWASRSIQLRMWGSDTSQGVAQPGTLFSAKAAMDSTYGWGDQNNGLQQGPEQKEAGETIGWETQEAYNIGNLLYIYNASSLSELDLSGFATELGSINAETAVDNFGRNSLRKLTLGDGEKENEHVTGITGLGKLTNLEALDIRGFKAITSLDAVAGGDPGLSALVNLNTLDARGSGLTSFRPAPGIHLTDIKLPETVRTIELESVSGTISKPSGLSSLTLRYCAAETIHELIRNITNPSYGSITIVFPASPQEATELSDADIEKIIFIGQNTGETGEAHFSGCITKASGGISASTYTALEAMNITYVGDVTPEVTVTSSDVTITEGACAIGSGESATFIATVIPPSAGTARFRLYNGTFVIAEDAQGKAVYNGVTLDCATGMVTVGEVAANFTVGITAYAGSVESAKITASIEQIVNIGGISAAAQTYTATGEHEVALTPQNAGYNVPVTSLEVSGDSGVSVVDAATLRLKVTVPAIPSATEQHTCTVTARDSRGNVFTCQLSYTIEVVRITSFSISGKENIYSAGNNYYELTDILPANHNKDITRLVATATASEGTFPVTVDGVRGFTVSITNMPDHNTPLTLRAEATLDDGSSVVATKTVLIKMASNIDILDELGVAIMHVDGSFYTAEEWQAQGFTSADANGVAASVAAGNERNRLLFSKILPDGTDESAYVFPDGTEGRLYNYSDDGPTTFRSVSQTIQQYLNVVCGTSYSELTLYVAYNGGKQKFDITTNGFPGAKDYVQTISVCTPRAIPLTKAVDLGLPSGMKWANLNVGARSPEESGLFFSWGNTDGHDGTDGYAFTSATYAETEGAAISGNLPVANDAAASVLGGDWRTPKVEEMQELIDNCTAVWTAVNNINGVRFTSNINGNSIFIPAYGLLTGTSQPAPGNAVIIPSDTLYSDRVKTLYYNNGSSTAVTIGSHERQYGLTFRPVQLPAAPSGVIISGSDSIGEAGSFAFTKAFTSDRYTGSVQSVAWSLQTVSQYASITAQTAEGATLTVTSVPAEETTITIQCTVTFNNGVTKTGTLTVTLQEVIPWVDLGLPSGLLWCKHNLGATNPEDAGLYFAWGETVGYADAAARNTALGRSDGFSSNAYTATGGAAITDSVLTWAHDAAAQIMGGDWRIPTESEFQELLSNTSSTEETINGVKGRRLTSIINGNSIFICGAGYYDLNSKNGGYGTGGYSASLTSSEVGTMYNSFRDVNIGSGSFGNERRYNGFPIRPVRMPTKAVDLDLPSGTLWADRNVGATIETDYGLYFSWGNVEGHKSSNGSTFDNGYVFGNSNSGPYAQTPGAAIPFTSQHKNADYSADGGYDAARELLGGSWRMPTANEFKELYDNTDNEWTSINGVYGCKFMKKSDHSVYVFFPAAGLGSGGALSYRGAHGRYWSSSLRSADFGYNLSINSSSVTPQDSDGRYIGYSVRAVQ